MARRKLLRREDYDRALRQGRGKGEGEDYKPFIHVHDFGSRGRSSKMPGAMLSRTHHFLSDHETRFHPFVEFDTSVVDIREQFPILPLQFSIAVAKDLGIRFPNVRGTKIPSIRTIDSLVTRVIDGDKKFTAYAIKEAVELRNKRVLALLEIERVCCELMGIPWFLVIDTRIPRVAADNLSWASAPMRGLFREEYEAWQSPDRIGRILDEISVGTHSIEILVETISATEEFDEGFSTDLLRSLLWKKYLKVDMTTRILGSGEITILAKADHIILERENYGTAG